MDTRMTAKKRKKLKPPGRKRNNKVERKVLMNENV